MITVSFLVLILAIGVASQSCPTGQQQCGSSGCYDPTIHGCNNDNTIIQCVNSCNGTCYSNSQYCFNNTKVCNNNELVCDVKRYNYLSYFPFNLTCYNSSQLICSNNTLCYSQYACGTQCLNDDNSVCANDNRTICYGFRFWNYYPYGNRYVGVCGTQQQCYDNRASVCLNETTVCQGLNAQWCATNCFNPDTQTCINDTVLCISSCNGACYSNSQYCYNNTKVCNNDELVCDVKKYSLYSNFPFNLTCYNSSQLICSNNSLCYPQYACGTQCLTNSYSVCANDNRTICYGFNFWNYYYYYYPKRYVGVCGTQQQCYDNATSVCLNETTVCQGLNAQWCATNCFNSDTQTCINGTVRCINSCNGTCYSNSQYCFNNTKVCNNNELVCDVTTYNPFSNFPFNLTCYNSSQLICSNNTLCYPQYACGTQCLTNSYSVCANDNRTICYGFYYWKYVSLCGPQQQCYDNTTSFCLGNNGTVCAIGNQLCAGVCYNPQSQYCTSGNNSVYCLNNPSSSNCLLTSTVRTSSTPRTTATNLSTSGTTVKTSTAIAKITTKSTLSASTVRTTAVRTTTMTVPSTCCGTRNCTRNQGGNGGLLQLKLICATVNYFMRLSMYFKQLRST